MQDWSKHKNKISFFLILLILFILLSVTAIQGTWQNSIRDVYCKLTGCNMTGHLFLEGDGRVKKEIQRAVINAARGSASPAQELRDVGSSGNVKVPVLSFSKVTQQDIYGDFHPPSDIDESENVSIHLMWIPGESYTSGNYVWKLEYILKDQSSNSTTETPTIILVNVTPTSPDHFIESIFPSTIDLNLKDILIAHFYRDTANDDADDVGEVRFIEIEYIANKLGFNINETI